MIGGNKFLKYTIILMGIIIGFFILLNIIIIVAMSFGTFVAGLGIFSGDNVHVTLPFKDEYWRPINITNNPAAKDPTFDQMIKFLQNDSTDGMNLSSGKAMVRLHDNAETYGYRAGIAEFKSAEIDLGNKIQGVYACDVFHTSDKGIIYVDDVGPDRAPADDYILFYHQRWDGGTSYAAYFIPVENISKINVQWKSYPDYSFDQQQINETGAIYWEFTIDWHGDSVIW